jgi:hypothetical protein
MDMEGDGGRREFAFEANAAEQKVKREPPQIRSPAKEKSLPSKIRYGTADKPTVKRQVVNHSARTALLAGTAGSKSQPGRCADSKENSRGETDSPDKQWVQTVKNC